MGKFLVAITAVVLVVLLTGCGSDESSSATPSEQTVTRVFTVEGMHCQGCATGIETTVGAVPGVVSVSVAYDGAQATVTCAESVTNEQLIAAMQTPELTMKPME